MEVVQIQSSQSIRLIISFNKHSSQFLGLGDFPLSKNLIDRPLGSQPHFENVEFLRGNIAIVDCYIPLNSVPTPIIEFELNNTLIDISGKSELFLTLEFPTCTINFPIKWSVLCKMNPTEAKVPYRFS